MSIFRRSRKSPALGERLPAMLSAKCLGASCAHFAGKTCLSRFELLQADGPSGGTDIPPLQGESSYTIYGQVCTADKKEQLVAARAQILKAGVPYAKIVALAGMYGDLPLSIESGSVTAEVTTLASSD